MEHHASCIALGREIQRKLMIVSAEIILSTYLFAWIIMLCATARNPGQIDDRLRAPRRQLCQSSPKPSQTTMRGLCADYARDRESQTEVRRVGCLLDCRGTAASGSMPQPRKLLEWLDIAILLMTASAKTILTPYFLGWISTLPAYP